MSELPTTSSIEASWLLDPDALGEAVQTGRVGFDDALLSAWEVRASMFGVIRSSADCIRRRHTVLADGSPGRFVVQHNPGRSSRRVPARWVDHVVEPFDVAGFHFSAAKIKAEEVLMRLQVDGVGVELLVNVHPLGVGHSLLVIEPSQLRAQVLEEQGLRAAHGVARLSRRSDFKVGFNSLAGCASVNHYHFQCLYFQGAGIHADLMASEFAELAPWSRHPGIGELMDYPVSGWSVTDQAPGGLARATAGVVRVLQEHDVPHNLLLTRQRAIVIPRNAQSCRQPAVGARMAFVEMHGEMIVAGQSEEQLQPIDQQMTEQQVALHIGALSIGRERFDRLSGVIADRLERL